MKKEVSPAVVAVVVVVLLGVVGFFLWKNTGGGGSLPTGTTTPANAGPFAPGGQANSQMGGTKPNAGGPPKGGMAPSGGGSN